MRKLLFAATVLGLATAADARESRNAVPAATEAGKPVDCVQLQAIRETRVHGDQVIDFHMRGGEVYRNTLPYSCPSLGFEERFAYKTSINQLCSVDTITVLYASPVQQGATCGLGKFQPVKLVKAAK